MKKEYRIAVAGTGYVGLSIAAPTNVYLKLSVAIWWSMVAYKTHAKYPYCEPVLLQSKVVTWYLHFSEELEVVRGDDCSCSHTSNINNTCSFHSQFHCRSSFLYHFPYLFYLIHHLDPLPLSTTPTVLSSILISIPIFQFLTYSISSFTTSSKSVISLLPLTGANLLLSDESRKKRKII